MVSGSSRDGLTVRAISPTDFFRGAARLKRLSRIHEKALLEGFATNEHAEAHLVAVAERRLSAHEVSTDLDIQQHDVPHFFVA